MTLQGLVLKIDKKLWYLKKFINKIRYWDLSGTKSQISIISCNCIGGVLMSELNMVFNTPTVNCYINTPDFLKLCQNLEEYMSMPLKYAPEPIQSAQRYPLIYLGDILIHAVHYQSFEEFCNTWNRRKARINYNRLFLIFTDRDNFEESLLKQIEELPYKKVLFSSKNYSQYDFICTISEFKNCDEVGNMTGFKKGITWNRRYTAYPFVKKFRSMVNS